MIHMTLVISLSNTMLRAVELAMIEYLRVRSRQGQSDNVDIGNQKITVYGC